MSLKISITTSEEFEGSLVLDPAYNYSDGTDKGFRPAIRWALIHMPETVASSGLMNLRDEPACETIAQALARSKKWMFVHEEGTTCICAFLVDAMLEEFEREP
jgi:hypothetical protein